MFAMHLAQRERPITPVPHCHRAPSTARLHKPTTMSCDPKKKTRPGALPPPPPPAPSTPLSTGLQHYPSRYATADQRPASAPGVTIRSHAGGHHIHGASRKLLDRRSSSSNNSSSSSSSYCTTRTSSSSGSTASSSSCYQSPLCSPSSSQSGRSSSSTVSSTSSTSSLYPGRRRQRHHRLQSLVLESVTPRDAAAQPLGYQSLSAHTEYDLVLTHARTGHSWRVARRFSSFVAFRRELHGLFARPHCHVCTDTHARLVELDRHFPNKRLWGSNKPTVVRHRAEAFETYVTGLLGLAARVRTRGCRLLAGGLTLHVRSFLTVESSECGGMADAFGQEIPSLLHEIAMAPSAEAAAAVGLANGLSGYFSRPQRRPLATIVEVGEKPMQQRLEAFQDDDDDDDDDEGDDDQDEQEDEAETEDESALGQEEDEENQLTMTEVDVALALAMEACGENNDNSHNQATRP